MSKEQQDLHCSIVSDLLPLYHDGVVSEITADAVQAHLSHCDSCTEEYNSLCAGLPAEDASFSTKQQFDTTMKKAKKKRFLLTALISLLSCAVLIAVFCFLMQVPIITIPDSDLEIVRSYRYEMDGESHFFVLYVKPAYTGYSNSTLSSTGGAESGTDDPYTLVLTSKKTVFARKADWTHDDIWIMAAEGIENDYEALQVGNTIIWTEEENGDDPVPDYVYLYHEYARHGDKLFAFWTTDIEKNLITTQYTDGRYLAWNLDGDLLYDGYPDETGSYPDFPF